MKEKLKEKERIFMELLNRAMANRLWHNISDVCEKLKQQVAFEKPQTKRR